MRINSFLLPLFLVAMAAAQGEPSKPADEKAKSPETQPGEAKPQIKINYLNVCNPGENERQEMKAALAKIPLKAGFTPDFEVSRGRTSLKDAKPARYVRLRRDMPASTGFSNAQYSLSNDAEKTVETLVLKLDNPKDLLMITLEDQISGSAVAPLAVLDADTPVSRIKLERFGKSSLVLSRCEQADQSAYEPLFSDATKLLAAYRKSLGLHGMFRSDLAWVGAKEKTTAKPEAKKTEPPSDKKSVEAPK